MKTGIFKYKKYWAWLGIVTVIALLFMILHTHAHEAGHEPECPVCHFGKTAAAVFLSILCGLFLTVLFSHRAENLFTPAFFLFLSFFRRGPPLRSTSSD